MTVIAGQVVEYTLSAQCAARIAEQRKDGTPFHGNGVQEGDTFPMVIARVWYAELGTVNGQVLLDGNDSLWVTSVTPGDGPYHWRPYDSASA